MKHLAAVPAIIMLIVFAAATNAQVPGVMSYQGTLTDVGGVAVADGNYTITFRIYELAEGGAPIWTESHLLAVVGGVFGATLGSVNTLSLPFDRAYYLGISIEGGAELAPRRRLTAAAYSLNARGIDVGVAVTSINGLKDNVSLVAGENVAITQVGNTLSVSATGGGGASSASTLDEAYDGGGSGAGREITADAGPVHIKGPDGFIVDGRIGVGVDPPLVPVDVVSADVYALYGETSTTEAAGAGVFGILNNQNANDGASGVIGVALDQNAVSNGVWGDHATIGVGVFGTTPDGFGVVGFAHGTGTENVGVYGESAAVGLGWAGYFYGDIGVVGQIYTGGSAMLIDHPQQPEQKYLYHASVHSPDMMNIYNGNVTLDAGGSAVVEMPDYFSALNRDFRYQLTAIGAPGPNLHVAGEINGNQFRIAGGEPGMKVSWTVTGIRQDPHAEKANRNVVREKSAAKTGHYFNPHAYGKSRSESTLSASHPRLLRHFQKKLRANTRNTTD